MPTLDRRPTRRLATLLRASLAAAALSLAAAAVASPASAAEPPIGVVLGGCDVSVDGPPSTQLTVRILAPSGKLRVSIPALTDILGSATATCSTTRIRGGDQVETRVTATNALVARFTVPRFRAVVDRDTDRITVFGPRNTEVVLDPITCLPGLINCGHWGEVTRSLGSAGKTTIDTTTTVNLSGSDGVDLDWQDAKGAVAWRIAMPHLDVLVGGAKVTGTTSIGRSVGVVVRTSGGKIRGTGSAKGAAPNGAFAAVIRKPNHHRVSPVLGDRVGAAALGAGARVTLVDLGLTLGATSIQFHCPGALPWSYEIVDGVRRRLSNGGTTDGTGLVDQGWSPDTYHGMRVVARCGTAAGDAIRAVATVP